MAITPGIADRLAVDLGDRATVGTGDFEVVGVVENPTDLDDDFALVVDLDDVGVPVEERTTSYLIDASVGAIEAESVGALGVEDPGQGIPPVRTLVAVAISVVVAVAMVQVALLSAAGFAVINRRRTRQYGLLAAIGSTPRAVSRSAAGLGLETGLVGATLGAVGAVCAVLAIAPTLESQAGHRISVILPWWTVAPGFLAGVTAAAVASWWPSRAIARQPIVATLAALRPASRPVRSSTIRAVVLGGLGGAGVLFAARAGLPLLAAVGAMIAVAGILLWAPMVVRTIDRHARRLSLPGQIAGRAIGRQPTQSAIVIAAIALALGVALATATAALAVSSAAAGDLPSNAAIVRTDVSADTSTVVPAAPFVPDDEYIARLDADYPTVDRVAIDVVLDPSSKPFPSEFVVAGSAPGLEPQTMLRPASPGSDDVIGFGELDQDGRDVLYVADQLWVATPEMATAIGFDVDLDSAAIVTSHADAVPANDRTRPSGEHTTVVVDDVGQGYSELASAFITPAAVEQWNADTMTIGWLLISDEDFSSADRAELRSLVAGTAVIEFREEPASSAQLRLIVVLVATVVGLVILVAATSLTRMELAADLRSLVAIGASPTTTRNVHAASGGLLSVGGALLALPFGMLVHVALALDANSSFGLSIPWIEVGVILVGFPAAAMLASLLGGRHPFDNPARRARAVDAPAHGY
jgi:putative ABC transport system permease protein